MKKLKNIYFIIIAAFVLLLQGCVFSTDENPVRPTEGYIVSNPTPAINSTGLNIILTLEWQSVEGNKFDLYLDTVEQPVKKIASDITEKNMMLPDFNTEQHIIGVLFRKLRATKKFQGRFGILQQNPAAAELPVPAMFWLIMKFPQSSRIMLIFFFKFWIWLEKELQI